MKARWQSVAALLACGLAVWPLSAGLSSLDEGDYLGAVLALAFTWLLARTALELADPGDDGGDDHLRGP